MLGVGRALPSLSAVGAYPQRVPPRGARALSTAGTARLVPHGSMTAAPQHGGLGAARAPGRLPPASRLACRVRLGASPRSASPPRYGARPAHVRRRSSQPRQPRTAGAAGFLRPRPRAPHRWLLLRHRSASGTAFRPGLPRAWRGPAALAGRTPSDGRRRAGPWRPIAAAARAASPRAAAPNPTPGAPRRGGAALSGRRSRLAPRLAVAVAPRGDRVVPSPRAASACPAGAKLPGGGAGPGTASGRAASPRVPTPFASHPGAPSAPAPQRRAGSHLHAARGGPPPPEGAARTWRTARGAERGSELPGPGTSSGTLSGR